MMKLTHLATAAAALALAGGAALAQQTGVTPNQPAPAKPAESKTGVPSVDSTRPTGANAGKTNLPGGEVTSSVPASQRTGVTGVVTPGDVEPVVPGNAAVGATAPSSATIADDSAPSATTAAVPASATVTTSLTTNGPVPDTPANRAKYGQPLSRAGKMTPPRGN